MKLSYKMSEDEFIDSIDCSFVYNTDEEYREATEIACSISDEAVLMVCYEIASSPTASKELNRELLDIIRNQRPSLLISTALPIVECVIDELPQNQADMQTFLEACRRSDSAWNGLCLLQFMDDSLYEECDKIREKWESTLRFANKNTELRRNG